MGFGRVPALTQADFCIEIDFRRGTESPERVFKAMAGLIESCRSADHLLVESIASGITSVLLLEDIEAGSLRTWLKQQLEDVEDEALKKLDWKPIVGHYLVKAKYRTIKFLEGRSTISSRSEIVDLQHALMEEAQTVEITPIPIHAPLPEAEIVKMIRFLTEPLSNLRQEEGAIFITDTEDARFNLDFAIAPEAIEELIVRETLSSETPMILKVKRPDYLGETMWEFRHEGHSLEAKFTDIEWLQQFQQRIVEVRPGDAVKANVKIEVRYGYDGEVVGKRYTILKVIDVIPLLQSEQQRCYSVLRRSFHPPLVRFPCCN